jgi:hypothetical protein
VQKEKSLLVRYSPALESFYTIGASSLVNWRYLILANDFEGVGVYKGFVRTEPTYAFYGTESPYHVEELTEEVLEEEYSNITIFGLNQKSKKRLHALIQTDQTPSIRNFLSDDELFINIVCGKQYGFFNGFLIKSPVDLQRKIEEFENVIDAGN